MRKAATSEDRRLVQVSESQDAVKCDNWFAQFVEESNRKFVSP